MESSNCLMVAVTCFCTSVLHQAPAKHLPNVLLGPTLTLQGRYPSLRISHVASETYRGSKVGGTDKALSLKYLSASVIPGIVTVLFC